MEAENELQSQRSKYEALEQTWMAANENFLKFQVWFFAVFFGWCIVWQRSKRSVSWLNTPREGQRSSFNAGSV